jgi:GNAT superfamily N-acetyltransferase
MAPGHEDGTVRKTEVRDAVVDDAPAMGRVMVESFLAAHRGQMPKAAFQKRMEEWTPEVSARGWARALAQLADGHRERDVILVAEGDDGDLLGLVSGGAPEREVNGTVAEIGALYVVPARQGRGIGGALLRAAAGKLAGLASSSSMSASCPSITRPEPFTKQWVDVRSGGGHSTKRAISFR